MAKKALDDVISRNLYYKGQYRGLLKMSLLLALVIVLLSGGILFVSYMKPTPTFFATKPDGTILPLKPLSQPIIADNTLLQWAQEAATAAYNFDFNNYRRQLQGLSKYFTPKGYNAFINSLKNSGTLGLVETKRLVVTAVSTGAAVITRQGYLNGLYQWEVQFPMLISFQSANEIIPRNVLVTLRVVRVSVEKSPTGIGISSYVAQVR